MGHLHRKWHVHETESLSRSHATRLLGERLDHLHGRSTQSTDRVDLRRAGGRVLAKHVEAPADTPRFDRATMDGFAFAAGDDGPLRVVDAVEPKDTPPDIAPGEAVEVTTGAPLPDRADAVVMREHATVTDGRLSGPTLTPGTNVYPAGGTAAAGERLFAAGQRLAPRHVALLRDVGVETVTVRERPSVAVVPTGTEIAEGREPDRDSDVLCNLLRRWGCRPSILDPVPDDAAAVRESVAAAAAAHDLVVTTGGTGAGRADHVVDVLGEYDVAFDGVALRPGGSVVAATVDGTPVCGLPGKPIAAHTAATLLVGPALMGASLAGTDRLPTVTTELASRVMVPEVDLEYAIPVTIDEGAIPFGHGDSALPLYDERFAPGRVSSSTRATLADGLVLTRSAIEAGDPVDVVPYEVIE